MGAIGRARVLIVDDEKSMRELLAIALEPDQLEVKAVASVADARRAMQESPFDLVVSDIAMPGESGMELLAELRRSSPQLPVILITAYASMESAKRAFSLGVYDCVDKGASFNIEEFRATVRNAIQSRQVLQENQILKKQLKNRHGPGTLVARSRKMQAVCDLIDRVAPTRSTLLITGESGTGKEVVARTIHYSGPGAEAPFVSINCGAMPSELLESELFGHMKGAFTGALAAKQGLFQAAREGTVFLDEIGEMPPSAQVRLLRVLQERTIRMVGGTEEIEVEARVVAATNADLAAKVEQGAFRADLYYRINVIPIHLPPLRERLEDISALAQLFVRRFARELGREAPEFSPECLRALEEYAWPGNVRELENAIQRAVTLAGEGAITPDVLPAAITEKDAVGAPPGEGRLETVSPTLIPEGQNLDQYLGTIKASLMERALEESNHVQVEAARRLGMSFRSFRYFAKQLGVHVHPESREREGGRGSKG